MRRTAASCAADPPGTRMRSPGTRMHARRRERASGHRARVRRRRRAYVRWCLAINPSAKKTTQKARARPRRERKWAARPRQTHTLMCFSRRAQCGARPVRGRGSPGKANSREFSPKKKTILYPSRTSFSFGRNHVLAGKQIARAAQRAEARSAPWPQRARKPRMQGSLSSSVGQHL